jgi:hypothetical protein
MRKSRVLLAGVAVAAAAAATSAFTASNSIDPGAKTQIAGYGEATVTGAHVTAIHYNRDATNKSLLAEVVFDSDSDLSGLAADAATLTLKTGTGGSAVFLASYDCAIVDGTPTTITCTVGDKTFEDFDTAGLAVGGE